MFARDSATESKVDTEDTEEVLSPQSDTITPTSASFGYCGTCGTLLGSDRNPQLLPCLHSVCEGCTPAQECPVCKQPYSFLEVKDNPFLKCLMSDSGTQETSKCAGCEDFAVSGWCVECGEALCSVCVSAHQRVRVTRDHTVLPQRLSTGAPDSTPTIFCSTHKEEAVRLFCMTCSQLTCRDCQLTYHRNHSYQFLHEAMKSQREQIEALMMRVRWHRDTVQQSLLDLDGRLLDLTALKSKLKDELQVVLVRMRFALMKRSVKLFKDIEGLCSSEAERVTERQATLRKLKERQDYVLAFTENALSTGNHIALLSSKKQIQVQLEDILSQNSLPASSMMDVMFHCDQDICSHVTRFGKIITKEVPFARLNSSGVSSKTSDLLRSQSLAVPIAPQTAGSHAPATISLAGPPVPADPFQAVPTSVPSIPTTLQHCLSTSSRASVSSQPLPAPPPSSHLNQSAPPSLATLPSLTALIAQPPSVTYRTLANRSQKTKKTWSFHTYQPKKTKLMSDLVYSVSPEASCSPSVESQPSPTSLSAAPMSISSPFTLCPAASPPVVIVLDPPTSVLTANTDVPNSYSVQCTTQTVSAAGQNTAPSDQWNLGFSIQSVMSLSDLSTSKDSNLCKNQSCLLPVKAPADSACESAPPAGQGRDTITDKHHAAENEPTSTVTEVESAFPGEATDVDGNDQREDESIPPISAQNEESSIFSLSNKGNSKSSQPEQGQSAPGPHLKLDGQNIWAPASFRELLERPSQMSSEAAISKTPVSKPQLPVSLRKLLVTDGQTASPTGGTPPADKQDDREEDQKTDAGNEDAQSDSFCDSSELSTSSLPLVSLWRLPIPALPLPGQPPPQFRLLPGSTKHRVLLQVIDECPPLTTSSEPEVLPAPHADCAACRTPGAPYLCVKCGRGFHKDCHIPPITSATCGTWKCLLCLDLSNDEDPYNSERERRPSLSMLDQKKCEYLLLALICKTYSSVLHHRAQLSSNYIDVTLIRGRLLRKLSPSYRTPSEFVSDVWVLLDKLLEVSEDTSSVVKLQECFQKKLSKTFGETLHPSLLKCPNSQALKAAEAIEEEEPREPMKRVDAEDVRLDTDHSGK